MKHLERFLAGVFCISILVVLVISAVEIAVYADSGYFRKEFTKYNVNNPKGIVNMDMDELVWVSSEMMDYLRGDRDNLDIVATIDGQQKEFFDVREKSHMADVRDLFVGALKVRWCAAAMAVISIISLFLLLYWTVPRGCVGNLPLQCISAVGHDLYNCGGIFALCLLCSNTAGSCC